MNKIKIRKAKLSDSKFIYKIYCESVKRNFFYSKKIVNYKKHFTWFKKKLKTNTIIYISTKSNKRFGYVRFEKKRDEIYQISIGNLPSYYNKGLGSKILNQSIKKFKKQYKFKKLIASIKKNNLRSIKCFEKNKFKKKKILNKNNALNENKSTKRQYYEFNNI